MQSFHALLLSGCVLLAASAPSQALDLSVQGLAPGMSFAQTEALLGPDYVYSEELEMDNMPGKVYTAIKGPNEGFALFYLGDHLRYLEYEIYYPDGGMPNLADFRKALIRKYGDNGNAFEWKYDRNGAPVAADAQSCDLSLRQQPLAFHHRGTSNLHFIIPRAWVADCPMHVDVMMGAAESNPNLVSWYQVTLANEAAVTDFLTAQAAEAKKAADAEAQAAKKNAPKL